VIVKEVDDRAQDIKTLEALLTHPDAGTATRKKITQQIKNIQVGLKGERDAAYHINFHLKDSKNWAVIHGIRLEHAGRVAQIDHLLINRGMEIWLCETKYWGNGIAINEHGEFTSFYRKIPKGIPSPLEQNRNHVAFFKKMIRDKAVAVPRRLGVSIKPDILSTVLVSTNARITRPNAKIDGLDSIIKSDQIASYIDKRVETETSFLSILKIISSQSLERFAAQFTSLHKPHESDWAAKFELSKATSPVKVGVDDGPMTKHKCSSCDMLVPLKVARYCWFNKDKFDSKIYCRICQ